MIERWRAWCIRKSKYRVSSQNLLSVCLHGQEKREKRLQERLCIFSCHGPNTASILGPLQTVSLFRGRTMKPFYWRGHWGLEEVWKIVRFGAHVWLQSLSSWHYNIIQLLCWEKGMGRGQKLLGHVAWIGMTVRGGHWRKRPTGWVLLLWEPLKSEENRSSSHVKDIHFYYLLWGSLLKVFCIGSICIWIRFNLSKC